MSVNESQVTPQYFEVRTFWNSYNVQDNVEHNSDWYPCHDSKKFLLLINLAACTLAPTDLKIDVEFSDDKVNWFKYQNDPFGWLKYEDTAPPLKECVSGDCIGLYVRVSITGAGCSGANYFTITSIKIILK